MELAWGKGSVSYSLGSEHAMTLNPSLKNETWGTPSPRHQKRTNPLPTRVGAHISERSEGMVGS